MRISEQSNQQNAGVNLRAAGRSRTAGLNQGNPEPRKTQVNFSAIRQQRAADLEGAKESTLADSVAALKGNKSSDKDLGNLSEQELYAANIHQQLSKFDPGLANRFAKQFKQELSKLEGANSADSNWKAADHVMRGFVRDGSVPHSQYKSFRDNAFGASQLDGDRSGLATTQQHSIAGSTAAASTNSRATAIEINDWKLSQLKAGRAARRGDEPRVNRPNEAAPAPSAPKTPSEADPSVDSTGSIEATQTPKVYETGLPIPDSKASAPNGFVWKPHSDSDGKLVIVLPSQLSGRAVKVEILSPNGNTVLSTGRYTGIANGFRPHFRFDKPGGAFPDNAIVKVTLADGQIGTVRIPNAGSRQE